MKNNLIQTEVDVKESPIKGLQIDGHEYISLTDLAKTKNDECPAVLVKKVMYNG